MIDKKIQKYYCKKHGDNGNPDCKECRDNLIKLCKDNNAHLTGDFK
jgi:hypothetical protein